MRRSAKRPKERVLSFCCAGKADCTAQVRFTPKAEFFSRSTMSAKGQKRTAAIACASLTASMTLRLALGPDLTQLNSKGSLVARRFLKLNNIFPDHRPV